MDDSGIDSDNRNVINSSINKDGEYSETGDIKRSKTSSSQLQKKMEKQLDNAKKLVEGNGKKGVMLSRNRLYVPGRAGNHVTTSPPAALGGARVDSKPLIDIGAGDSDSELDPELEVPDCEARRAHRELTKQMQSDGFAVSVPTDDDGDELDLIPPRPLHERGWGACCSRVNNSCSVM